MGIPQYTAAWILNNQIRIEGYLIACFIPIPSLPKYNEKHFEDHA